MKVLSWSSATPPEKNRSVLTPLIVSSQTPVPQLLGNLIEKGIARKFYLSIIIERHLSRIPSRYGSRQYSNVYRTSLGSPRKNEED